MSGVGAIAPDSADEPTTFVAADGWVLSGTLRPAEVVHGAGRAVVLVHGSQHTRDTFVYARALPAVLARRGIASVRFDIRGRGDSRGERPWTEMTVHDRRQVSLDVEAAVGHLCRRFDVDTARVGVVGEQDTAPQVIDAVTQRVRVGALTLLSPRLDRRSLESLAHRPLPVCAMVSKEDRFALRSAVAAYVRGVEAASELKVFAGLGFGATMFMSRAFEQPDEPSIEELIASYFDRVLR